MTPGRYPPRPGDARFSEWLLSETADWATTLQYALKHQDWKMVEHVVEDLRRKCELFTKWTEEEGGESP